MCFLHHGSKEVDTLLFSPPDKLLLPLWEVWGLHVPSWDPEHLLCSSFLSPWRCLLCQRKKWIEYNAIITLKSTKENNRKTLEHSCTKNPLKMFFFETEEESVYSIGVVGHLEWSMCVMFIRLIHLWLPYISLLPCVQERRCFEINFLRPSCLAYFPCILDSMWITTQQAWLRVLFWHVGDSAHNVNTGYEGE